MIAAATTRGSPWVPSALHPVLVEVTDRLRARSADTRASYTTMVVLIMGTHSVRRCGSMTRRHCRRYGPLADIGSL